MSQFRISVKVAVLVFITSAIIFVPIRTAATLEVFGTKLVNGSDWLGGQGADVYSNGNNVISNDYSSPAIGMKWQCVELAQRLYNKMGWHSGLFANTGAAYQIYDNASQLGMQQKPNNGSYLPVPGDMIIHSPTSDYPAGHVSVVDRVEGNVVRVVEQNASPTGRADYSWNSSGLSRSSLTPIRGIVHDPDNKLINSVDPATRNPTGVFEEAIAVSGGVRLKGYTSDPDEPGNIRAHAYINDQFAGEFWADLPGHRFDVTLATSGYGYFGIRIFAINVGPGTTNPDIGGRTIFHAYPVGYGHPYGSPPYQSFVSAFNTVGGAPTMGLGMNAAHWWGPGCIQDFTGGSAGRGAIMQRGCIGGAYAVTGQFWTYLEAFKGSGSSIIGYPYNFGHRWGPGWVQDFDGGQRGSNLVMIGDRVGRVHNVFGGIRHEYVKNGGAESRLGYPVSEEYPWYGEIHQGFEGGWVCWRTNNTSYVVWK